MNSPQEERERVDIEEALSTIRTQQDFARVLKLSVPVNIPKPGEPYRDPAGLVRGLYYEIRLRKGWGRKLSAFENGVIALLADPESHGKEIFESYAVGDIVWKGIRDFMPKSPNAANGRLANRLMREIDLEAIVSGELKHTDVQDSEWYPVANQSSPEYRAQRVLTNLLFSVQQKELPGQEYWEQIASNPSFIEIAYRLADATQDKEAIESMLPEVAKFYKQLLKRPHALAEFEEFVSSYSRIILESTIAEKHMTVIDALRAASEPERIKTLRSLDRKAQDAITASDDECVVILTGIDSISNPTKVEYVRITDEILHRDKASLTLIDVSAETAAKSEVNEGLYLHADKTVPAAILPLTFRTMHFLERYNHVMPEAA